MNKITLLRQLKSNNEELKRQFNKRIYNSTPVKIIYLLGLLILALLIILNLQKSAKSVKESSKGDSSFMKTLKLQLVTWLIDLAKKELVGWIKKRRG